MSLTLNQTPGTQPDADESLVVDFLRQLTAYPNPTSKVQVVETHISWVFLTDRFAYKLKKPVRFEFLDFSSRELRRAACVQELNLNRRLAPDVYLEVLPITVDSRGRLRLGGTGRAIEWVVKMKRLPASCSLDQLLQQQRLTANDVDSLAAALAHFYARLPPKTVNSEEYWRRIDHHLRANLEELASPVYGFDPWLVRRVHGAQLRFITIAREALIDRVRDGRVVDGHGDLRPEHIYFTSAPKIIDCLEFSEDLRTIDVADELAFLAMECDRLGAEWVGQRILSAYCATNLDRPPGALMEFFKSYRACVRAKVNAIRSRQVKESSAQSFRESASDYLRLADRSARRIGPPLVLVVRGLSGTGKSTVASALSASLGCDWLQTDSLRRRIIAERIPTTEFGAGQYSPRNRQLVYDEMFRLAADQVSHGLSVVLDGTFLTHESCRRAIQLAEDHQAVPLLVTCTCPMVDAMERVRERGFSDSSAVSDARPEFVARQMQEQELPDPEWPACAVDTTEGLSVNCQFVFDALRPVAIPDSADSHMSELCS